MRDLPRTRKVPCPCSYCLSERPDAHNEPPMMSMAMRESSSTRENHVVRESPHSQMVSPHKRETASSSPDDLVIEEKCEKESNDSSSGFEELSPNGQSGSESTASDRPESKQAIKMSDINMQIAKEGDTANSVIKISLEINGVMYKGTLESMSTNENSKEE